MADIIEEKKDDLKEEEKSEEKIEETSETDDEPGETDPADPDALSADQLKEAENLYKSLRNPQTARPLVAALMEQVGMSRTADPPNKSEEKKLTRTVKDIVKDKLGKQYEFIAEPLGDAIEAAFAEFAQGQNGRFAEIQQSQLERDIESSMAQLRRETKGESKQLESRMVALANEIPIGQMSVDTYVKRLHTLAVGEGQKSNARQMSEKIHRNASDAPGRLRGTPAGDGRDKIPNKVMSLSESVKFAMDQQLSQRK